jgi:restriction system protein
MTDAIAIASMPLGGVGHRLREDRRKRSRIGHLLDAMPWWALVGLAAATFLVLHQLAVADGRPAYGTAVTGPTASQLILIILAGAGQYLFPVLLLAEAAGVAVASRRARLWECVEPVTAALCEQGQGSHQPAQLTWSPALLTRLEPQRFAALAMAYYRERGMRCDLLPSGAEGAIVLRLFQEGLGKPPVVIQFRAKGAAWVGAKQIRALREVMNRERVEKGLFMTQGAFSRDARECASANGITLIDGKLFAMMIGRLDPVARERLLVLAMQAD